MDSGGPSKKQKTGHPAGGGAGGNPQRIPIVLPSNVTTQTTAQYEATLTDVLSDFWEREKGGMRGLTLKGEQEFKNDNDLPLARIKRIMKSDEDVRMIR